MVTHADQLVVTGAADPELISRLLGEQGHWVRELTPLTPDLESVFLALTAGRNAPTSPSRRATAPRRRNRRSPSTSASAPPTPQGATE